MEEEKWKVVGGRVYQLAKTFDNLTDAVEFTKTLKEKHHVFLSRTKSGAWSVYWRARVPEFECSPRYLDAAQMIKRSVLNRSEQHPIS